MHTSLLRGTRRASNCQILGGLNALGTVRIDTADTHVFHLNKPEPSLRNISQFVPTTTVSAAFGTSIPEGDDEEEEEEEEEEEDEEGEGVSTPALIEGSFDALYGDAADAEIEAAASAKAATLAAAEVADGHESPRHRSKKPHHGFSSGGGGKVEGASSALGEDSTRTASASDSAATSFSSSSSSSTRFVLQGEVLLHGMLTSRLKHVQAFLEREGNLYKESHVRRGGERNGGAMLLWIGRREGGTVNEVEFVEAPFIDEKSGTEYFSLQLHTVSKRAIPCLASSIASTHLLVSRLSLPLPTPPSHVHTRTHTHTLSLSAPQGTRKDTHIVLPTKDEAKKWYDTLVECGWEVYSGGKVTLG